MPISVARHGEFSLACPGHYYCGLWRGSWGHGVPRIIEEKKKSLIRHVICRLVSGNEAWRHAECGFGRVGCCIVLLVTGVPEMHDLTTRVYGVLTLGMNKEDVGSNYYSCPTTSQGTETPRVINYNSSTYALRKTPGRIELLCADPANLSLVLVLVSTQSRLWPSSLACTKYSAVD